MFIGEATFGERVLVCTYSNDIDNNRVTFDSLLQIISCQRSLRGDVGKLYIDLFIDENYRVHFIV